MYFVGRSHNWSLLCFAGPSFMLLTILGDELWSATKTSRLFSYRIIFAVVIFVLAIASVEMLFSVKEIWTLNDDRQAKMQQIELEKNIRSNQKFIKANTFPYEKIFVFTNDAYQGLYFYPNKNRSAVNPGFMDLVLNTELDAYVEAIRDSSFKIFIEPQFLNRSHLMPILSGIAATYEFEKQNGSMFLLEKRMDKTAYNGVLGNNRAIVHEIFSDDTIGFRKRVDYMQGAQVVKLEENTVTAEVVFKPGAQLYQYAVLLGNQNDSLGFSIFCIDQQASYGVSIADQMVSFTVNSNQVNYLAVSIHERTITLFLNGNLVGNYLLSKPYKPSDARLHVGNYSNYLRYYVGDIYEICLTATPLTEVEVKRKWNLINP